MLIVSKDKVKAAMSEAYWPHSRKVFPPIEYIGEGPNEYRMYTSRYYPKVRSLKNALEPKEYTFYRYLCNLDRRPYDVYPYTYYQRQFKGVPWKTKRDSLLEALDCLMNYADDPCFEISPRNVAVWRGKLILLDCFFFKHQL